MITLAIITIIIITLAVGAGILIKKYSKTHKIVHPALSGKKPVDETCGGVTQNLTVLNEADPCGGVTENPIVIVDDSFNFNDFGISTEATVPESCEGVVHAPAVVMSTSIGGRLKKKTFPSLGKSSINGYLPEFLSLGGKEKFTNLQRRAIEYNSIGSRGHPIEPINLEPFTNEQGGNIPTSMCSSLTLGDCIKTSTCDWVMKDGLDGSDSQCVPKTSERYQRQNKYSKIYSNDVWTRANLANDNDYKNYIDEPVFD
jgi:hypothetical protein